MARASEDTTSCQVSECRFYSQAHTQHRETHRHLPFLTLPKRTYYPFLAALAVLALVHIATANATVIVPDASGHGHDAVFLGDPLFTSDCAGTALQVDGTVNYGTVQPTPAQVLQELTVEGSFRWLGNMNEISAARIVIDKCTQSEGGDWGRSWTLYINKNTRRVCGQVFYNATNGYELVEDPEPLPDPMTTCVHVAMTVSTNGELRLYRNGVLKDSTPFLHNSINYLLNTQIGFASSQNGTAPFAGCLDEFRLSDIVRTSFPSGPAPLDLDQHTVALWRFDGPPSPRVTVTSPDGGERWAIRSSRDITWTSTAVSNVKIEYSTNNGSSWMPIAESFPSVPSRYEWQVPDTPSQSCRVRVSDTSNPSIKDISDYRFSIVSCTTPFGSNGGYGNGIALVNSQTIANARDAYLDWKEDFVTDINAGPYRRVKYERSTSVPFTTKSEGIGYGMLLSAYYGDQELFDDLFQFSRLHQNQNGLMCWLIGYEGHTPLPGSPEHNAAIDGDEDIAMALILAEHQWGSSSTLNYADSASLIIDAIYDTALEPPSHLLLPGDEYGAETCLNPSYFALAYYPYFRVCTGNAGWYSVATECAAALLTLSRAHSSGLIGDWASLGSNPPSGSGCDSCRMPHYGYDASRIPWRAGVDYLWTGRPELLGLCEQTVTQITTVSPGGIAGITDGYYVDTGEPIPLGTVICDVSYGWRNNPVIAGLQTAAMTMGNPQLLTDLYNENCYERVDDYFFNRTLRVMSLFVASGNWWAPPLYSGEEPEGNVTRGVSGPGLVEFNLPGNVTATRIEFRGGDCARERPDTSVVTVRRYDEAPIDPVFLEGTPSFVSPYRWTIARTDSLPLDAEVRFNLSEFCSGVPDPANTSIFRRGTEGIGTFWQLATIYDSTATELRADVPEFGEFILASNDGWAFVDDGLQAHGHRADLSCENSPNPCRGETTIRYLVPTDGVVSLVVYDVAGQEVATLVNENQEAGLHQVVLRGNRLASGVYFYRLRTAGIASGRKILLLK